MQQPDEQHSADAGPPAMGGEVALIALGANLESPIGGPAESVRRAMEQVGTALGDVVGQSALYRTPCFPAGTGPDYVNAAMAVRGTLSPAEILGKLHDIEALFRRDRIGRWRARTLDLDLLAVGDRILPDAAVQAAWRDLPLARQMTEAPDTLILPHPRLQERGFVLAPLAEIAPDWRHPALDVTVRQMYDALPPEALADVRRI